MAINWSELKNSKLFEKKTNFLKQIKMKFQVLIVLASLIGKRNDVNYSKEFNFFYF